MKYISICLFMILLFTHLSCGNNKSSLDALPKKSSHNKIEGVWHLIELSDFDSSSMQWNYPYGKHPKGYFIYGNGNTFTINISSEAPLKMPFDSALHFNIGITDLMEKYYLGFFGTYTIDSVNSVIIHHVTGGSAPFYIDTDQPRPYFFKGDTLVIGDGITWKRVMVRDR